MVYITLQNVMETEVIKDIICVDGAGEGGQRDERVAPQPPRPTRGLSSLPTGAGPCPAAALAAGAAGSSPERGGCKAGWIE